MEYYRQEQRLYEIDENLLNLPENLPRPYDDGKGDSIIGMNITYRTPTNHRKFN